MSKTAEERAFNYAITQKPTKLQVGEIAKHYNNGYNQAFQDFLEKAEKWLEDNFSILQGMSGYWVANNFKNYMQDESEN